MKRYALFGGTFDPFTPGHRAIVKALLAKKKWDNTRLYNKVWIAPTVVNYYRKDKDLWLSDAERCEVICEMLSDLTYGVDWKLFDKDIRMKSLYVNKDAKKEFAKNRRFLDTLIEFKDTVCQPDDIVDVVIGSDSLQNFKTWYKWEEILEQANLVVVPGRESIDLPVMGFPMKGLTFDIIKIDSKFKDCSATSYRKMYRPFGQEGKSMYINEVVKLEVEGCKCLLKTPIFDVVEGLPVEEVGGLKPVRLKAPDWVMVIVKKNDHFLVERQLRLGAMKMVEEFPCGIVEPNEEPRAAAARELREETGILVSSEKLIPLGTMNPNPAFMSNTMHLFALDLDANTFEECPVKLDQHERIEVLWKPVGLFIRKVFHNVDSGEEAVPAMLVSAIAAWKNTYKHGVMLKHIM